MLKIPLPLVDFKTKRFFFIQFISNRAAIIRRAKILIVLIKVGSTFDRMR